jgi:four helix bundle protein
MAGKISSFKDLDVWKRSRKLVKTIYLETYTFPEHERYGLAKQMQRAVISIPSNIAEGFSRHGTKDYINFVSIALGSMAELQTQIYLAYDLEYLSRAKAVSLVNEIEDLQRMLQRMRTNLKSKL